MPGSELPTVILPGLLCDGRMFDGQLRGLDRAVVVSGHYGGADRLPAMADYALRQMPPLCVLIGHSMGARVALEVWRRAPERVAALVLADNGVHLPQPGEREKRMALLDLGRREGVGALVAEWLPPMIGPRHRDDYPLVAMLTEMCASAGVETYAAQIEALLHRPEVESLLPTIGCPALVITGSDDAWSPPAQHATIAAALPGSRLVVIDGAGHMLPAEMPDAFNAAVRTWLKAQAGVL